MPEGIREPRSPYTERGAAAGAITVCRSKKGSPMALFFKKIASLFLSAIMFLGLNEGGIEMKKEIPVPEVTLSAVDITNGYTVTVPFLSGMMGFNRISFSYEATAAVRAVVSYRMDFKTFEEELLLSSKSLSASMLLNGYLERKTASRLVSVRFEPVKAGESCVFSVSSFTCGLQNVPKKDVLFIENEHYKAGVNLKWGGGLSWFEDKTNAAYGNLLNDHDTGRLVQQSYYGPLEIEGYENGVYGDNVWNYNPVQGGDMYGNPSKLVAVEKSEDTIRVVSRPLDWAQNDMLTQTYYTSEYRLTDRGLTVKNTAVDFLGTPWTDREQELPAFYAVSALGAFWFYDGDKPWTRDELRVERQLPFWGGKPAFQLGDGNNETWCAWTDDSGYGVGLFTPKATSLLAGRYEYDGSADPGADSTNYVAPLGVFGLKFDEPHSYFYYLTAGTVDEIRATFQSGGNLEGGDFIRVFPDMGVCDPHVHIFDGKAYLFSSHDYGPGQPIYRMDDWRVFSSDDLVNWDLEFTLRPEDTFLGEDHECYATDAAERNGKYYLYFSDQQRCTGVAVSENGPGGPYVDALGEPLLPQGLVDTACYDPTVFIDDDENKTPYIMFGYTVVGKKYYIARLNEDMISLAEEPKAVEVIDGWENDACWITKWGDTYYLNSHGGDYATSKNIYGPYTYRGKICEDCFTDHGTFFTFHNQTYFTYAVPENYGSGEPLDPYYRTTKFVYAHMKDNGDIVTDGFIKKVGVGQYDATWESIKGEWFFDAADGIVKKENADGFELRGIKDGSYLSFPNMLNVSADALLKLRVANGNDRSCTVEIHNDDPDGELLGSCEIGSTGGFDQFETFDVALSNTAGTNGICFVFRTDADEALRFEDFSFANAD